MIVPGIILAGGGSTRMGRPKALLPAGDGATFISRLVRTLRAGGVVDVVVVAADGGPLDAIAAALASEPPEPRLVINPDPSRGQLSSILAGLRAIDRPGVDAMLFTLVDMPLVAPSTVRVLLEAYRRLRPPIVRPARGDRAVHGHPVIFDRSLFAELHQAAMTTGAKPVVRAHQSEIAEVTVDDEGAFVDIDTPDDYRRVFGRSLPDVPSTR